MCVYIYIYIYIYIYQVDPHPGDPGRRGETQGAQVKAKVAAEAVERGAPGPQSPHDGPSGCQQRRLKWGMLINAFCGARRRAFSSGSEPLEGPMCDPVAKQRRLKWGMQINAFCGARRREFSSGSEPLEGPMCDPVENSRVDLSPSRA